MSWAQYVYVGELAQQHVRSVEKGEMFPFTLAPCHLWQMGELDLEQERWSYSSPAAALWRSLYRSRAGFGGGPKGMSSGELSCLLFVRW